MTLPVDPARAFFERHYWSFLAVREAYRAAAQPVIRYWKNPDGLNELEQKILESIRDRKTILDIGAGDLSYKRKFEGAGIQGRYLTLDPTREFDHNFAELSEVAPGSCDAAIISEVIEHIPLSAFFGFVDQVIEKLTPDGRLVFSTPNADFVGGIWSADFTHVHAYAGSDLAAFLHLHGFESMIYRIAWQSPHSPLRERLRYQAARIITRGILQVDYARGMLVIAQRVRNPKTPAPAR
jgi:hypothetical protein